MLPTGPTPRGRPLTASPATGMQWVSTGREIIQWLSAWRQCYGWQTRSQWVSAEHSVVVCVSRKTFTYSGCLKENKELRGSLTEYKKLHWVFVEKHSPTVGAWRKTQSYKVSDRRQRVTLGVCRKTHPHWVSEGKHRATRCLTEDKELHWAFVEKHIYSGCLKENTELRGVWQKTNYNGSSQKNTHLQWGPEGKHKATRCLAENKELHWVSEDDWPWCPA